MATTESANVKAALAEIAASVGGEVRGDALVRAMYATDASIYEIIPDGVVYPRNADDIRAVVRICAKHGVPVTPRGAGTGLHGGTVNRGIQLDLSRHMNRIVSLDVERQRCKVQPGVVLDELNAELARHGLQFPPDVATSSRANVGGMIGNNSCGAHSIIYGRTCDYVMALDVVLSDGSTCTWGVDHPVPENPLARKIEEAVIATRRELDAEIEARWPKVLRRNGGYAFDRVKSENGRANIEQIIVGSEGTLAIVVAAELKVIPLPKHRALVVVHFADMLEGLGAVPAMLEHKPAAVELIDKLILDEAKHNAAIMPKRWFLQGDPAAILAVEFYDDDAARIPARIERFVADMQARNFGYAHVIITDAKKQVDVWDVRKAGTGLLMSRPGDTQPLDFVDDTAVDPTVLRDYIAGFQRVLAEEGVTRAGYYAHASVGCLHVRPALNLKDAGDIGRLRRIGDKISTLAAEFGGTMTGEHGDGLVRSEWLPKMYGPQIMEGFRRVKNAFDPQGILNPGKIVNALPMDANLRYGTEFRSQKPLTVLDFSTYGGMAGLAEMCSGIGQCRQRLVGTMCPSYMATGNELHTTRARANALRQALSNRGLLDGLADPALKEVFDLCLNCKACKTECPTGTDVGKLKTEWMAFRNRTFGVSPRSRLLATSVTAARWGNIFAPMSNWVLQSGPVRWLMEKRYGIERRVPPPRFSRRTFRQWWRREGSRSKPAAGSTARVVLFVDTWMNHYLPQVGVAAVRVLRALGREVLVAEHGCCARPLISQGLLSEAKILAERSIEKLCSFAADGVPIVVVEPSCLSAMVDEWPQLVRDHRARRVADAAVSIEAFVTRALAERGAGAENPFDAARLGKILFHGHCHQKAMFGTGDAMAALTAASGGQAAEINSGCCGMAGSFGHEHEHYDVAQAVGEQRLFPAIRNRGEAEVAVCGFSCRHQIEHHTGVHARHVVELLAQSLRD